MPMKGELDIVADVTERLERASIPFMLTGSMAMNYYAVPRMTRDIDIVIDLALTAADRFAAAFSPDYLASADVVREAISHESMFNLIHIESVIKIDFVIRKASDYRRAEFDRRRRIKISGFETWIVSLEDLILSKLVWARDSRSQLQLGDVTNLLLVKPDEEYLRRWADELRVNELLEECRSE